MKVLFRTDDPSFWGHVLLNLPKEVLDRLVTEVKKPATGEKTRRGWDVQFIVDGVDVTEGIEASAMQFINGFVNGLTDNLAEKTERLDQEILEKAQELLKEKLIGFTNKLDDCETYLDDLLESSED